MGTYFRNNLSFWDGGIFLLDGFIQFLPITSRVCAHAWGHRFDWHAFVQSERSGVIVTTNILHNHLHFALLPWTWRSTTPCFLGTWRHSTCAWRRSLLRSFPVYLRKSMSRTILQQVGGTKWRLSSSELIWDCCPIIYKGITGQHF